MRKFAGKCLALLLALLMPLTSMPVSLAESYTSEPFNVNVETPSREEVIEDAVNDNTTSGAYVELYSAVAESATVSTGAEFTYSVGYVLNAAPTYRNDQGDMVPAYSQYENVTITVTVPDGIVLLEYTPTPTSENTYTISLGNRSVTGGAGQTLSLRARMTGNGTVPNKTPYGKLGVSIKAGVAGSQTPFSYALPDARNNSAVTSEAKGEWKIEKALVGTPAVNGEEVTLTWQIKIGKVSGTAISSDNSVYQTEGALNFVDGSFSLTDTLPTIIGKDGVEYKPLRSTLSADGMTDVNGGAGDTELTTHHMLVIPDKSFYNGVMNDTNVTTGSYYGSKMKTSGLANALATVKADFGADHILTHRILLANAVSNGASSGWAWYDSQIDLMNEHMVYGSYAWGGGAQNGYDVGADKSQLALFQARPDLITNRENWWLRDVRSATGFCDVNYDGTADAWSASLSLGVRPAFLIY